MSIKQISRSEFKEVLRRHMSEQGLTVAKVVQLYICESEGVAFNIELAELMYELGHEAGKSS